MKNLLGRLASRQRGVWTGGLITAGVHAFSFLHRGMGYRSVSHRFISDPKPSTEGFTSSTVLLPAATAVAADPIQRELSILSGPPNHKTFSAISWKSYDDVLLPVGDRARRTAWFSGEHVIIEQSEMDTFDPRNFAKHLDLVAATGSRSVARRHQPGGSLQSVIYPGSFAPGNWYHWLMETLPRIWLADRLPSDLNEVPLLVHRGFLDVPAIRQTLNLVRGTRRVHTIRDFDWLRVERLIWIDGMFSMKHHSTYPDGRIDQSSSFHPAMRDFRDAILKSRRSSISQTPRRVFLDRGGAARTYNDVEVKSALASRGFVPVEAGSLDIAGQVELFANAEALVGPSGAAWANLLFATPQAKALYWTPSYFAGTQIWASIGALVDVLVHEHTYPQAFGTYHYGEYTIDVRSLLDHVDAVLEGSA